MSCEPKPKQSTFRVGLNDAHLRLEECVFEFFTGLHNDKLEFVAEYRTETSIAIDEGFDKEWEERYWKTSDTLPRWDWRRVDYSPQKQYSLSRALWKLGGDFADIVRELADFIDCFNAFNWKIPPEDTRTDAFVANAIAMFNPNFSKDERPENNALTFVQDVAMFPRTTIGDNDDVYIGAGCIGNVFPEYFYNAPQLHELHEKLMASDFARDFERQTQWFKDFAKFVATTTNAALKECYVSPNVSPSVSPTFWGV